MKFNKRAMHNKLFGENKLSFCEKEIINKNQTEINAILRVTFDDPKYFRILLGPENPRNSMARMLYDTEERVSRFRLDDQ